MQHQPLATPQLNVNDQPRKFRAMHEMSASWKIITENLPQPRGIDPVRRREIVLRIRRMSFERLDFANTRWISPESTH